MLRLRLPSLSKNRGSYAGMAELADVQDLGSCAARRVGSTPTTRTRWSDPTQLPRSLFDGSVVWDLFFRTEVLDGTTCSII